MRKAFILSAFFLLCFFSAFFFLQKSMASGSLLAYWKLDESDFGSTVIDSSGNEYNGTPHNDPLPQEEKPPGIQFTDPYSLSFNKSQWVSIPDDPAFAMSSATFSVWVKFSSLTDDMNMIAKRSSDGSQIQWQFGYSGGLNQFKVSLANDGGHGCCTDYNWSPNPSISTDTWYNIAVTINANTHKLRWYQNGQFKTEQDITGSNLGTQIADADLILGASQNGLTERLHGSLDDVRIYNAALTDQEVEAIGTGETGPGVPSPTPTSTPTPSPTPTPTPTSTPLLQHLPQPLLPHHKIMQIPDLPQILHPPLLAHHSHRQELLIFFKLIQTGRMQLSSSHRQAEM